jgi:hypothetical protein
MIFQYESHIFRSDNLRQDVLYVRYLVGSLVSDDLLSGFGASYIET